MIWYELISCVQLLCFYLFIIIIISFFFVHFGTGLIEHISNVRGCNYYSVINSDGFKKRMNEEFEYMVTPLVFNVMVHYIIMNK